MSLVGGIITNFVTPEVYNYAAADEREVMRVVYLGRGVTCAGFPVGWSLVAGIARGSGTPLRPSKGSILKRFSTPYIKPFRGHCAVQFQQLRTTSVPGRVGGGLADEERHGAPVQDGGLLRG